MNRLRPEQARREGLPEQAATVYEVVNRERVEHLDRRLAASESKVDRLMWLIVVAVAGEVIGRILGVL